MAPFRSALTDAMAWQMAAYCDCSAAQRDADPWGRAVWRAAVRRERLRRLPRVSGRGGILGPELTAIGALRGAPYPRDAIVKPAAAHPLLISSSARCRQAARRCAAFA